MNETDQVIRIIRSAARIAVATAPLALLLWLVTLLYAKSLSPTGDGGHAIAASMLMAIAGLAAAWLITKRFTPEPKRRTRTR